MIRYIQTSLICLTILSGSSQNMKCFSEAPEMIWENEFGKLITEQKRSSDQSVITYTIPVIFHVMHNGEPTGTFPNITALQIQSQITVLNQDFSGTGCNYTLYPSNAFANWAVNQSIPQTNLDDIGRVKIADVNIRFCLAAFDTTGNLLSEPGIDRINIIQKGWPSPLNYTTTTTFRNYMDTYIKPYSIWNVSKYLNIWISDKSTSFQYGGYSTTPPLSGLQGLALQGQGTYTNDGIWCYTKGVGSNNIYPNGQYANTGILGRTLTHEAGHYFGLRHIWGDATCGNDFCIDTPPAYNDNVGTPTYPHNAGTCNSPSNSPDGEMFMNFMDYTADPRKYMFTQDQADRMQTAMINSPYRNQLSLNSLCQVVTDLSELHEQNNCLLSPDPASEHLDISCGHTLLAAECYDPTGKLLLSTNTNKIMFDQLPAGIYFIRIQTERGYTIKRFLKN